MSWVGRLVLVAVTCVAAACSSVSTVRVQPESLYVGPKLRPIAVVHAEVSSAYFLFIPLPGGVDLDREALDRQHRVGALAHADAAATAAQGLVGCAMPMKPPSSARITAEGTEKFTG